MRKLRFVNIYALRISTLCEYLRLANIYDFGVSHSIVVDFNRIHFICLHWNSSIFSMRLSNNCLVFSHSETSIYEVYVLTFMIACRKMYSDLDLVLYLVHILSMVCLLSSVERNSEIFLTATKKLYILFGVIA